MNIQQSAPSESSDSVTESQDDQQRLIVFHLRVGWWSLLIFLTLGLILEGMHGLKVGWYLDVSQRCPATDVDLGTCSRYVAGSVAYGVRGHSRYLSRREWCFQKTRLTLPARRRSARAPGILSRRDGHSRRRSLRWHFAGPRRGRAAVRIGSDHGPQSQADEWLKRSAFSDQLSASEKSSDYPS